MLEMARRSPSGRPVDFSDSERRGPSAGVLFVLKSRCKRISVLFPSAERLKRVFY